VAWLVVLWGCGSPNGESQRASAEPQPVVPPSREPAAPASRVDPPATVAAERGPVFVCAGCPLADDRNPGTEVLPLRSLAGALGTGHAVVRLAAVYALEPAFIYREDVQLPAGTRLEGRWRVTGEAFALRWTSADQAAVIAGTVQASEGSVQVNGVEVRGRLVLDGADAALSHLEVLGATAVGIDVSSGSVQLDGVHVGAGPAIGLWLRGARAVLHEVTIDGVAVGALFDHPLALEWRGGFANAFIGADCAGVRWLGGALEASLIEDVDASGCMPVAGAPSPLSTRGIAVDGCGADSAPLTLRRVRATGGWLGGGYAPAPSAIGVEVRGECPVTLEQSDVLGAVDTFSEAGWHASRAAAGVVCEHAPCVVAASRSIVGAAPNAPAELAYGIWCDHGCRELADNRGVTAGAGLQQAGVLIDSASPVVVRNAITSKGAAPACVRGAGLESRRSESFIADNLVVAPFCRSSSQGLALGSGGPTVVSNTILGREAAVRFDTPATFINNVLLVEPSGVALESLGPQPALLSNNDLFVRGGGVLYRRAGVDFTQAAQIGTASLSVDPLFTADPPHLMPASLLRGAGCVTGVVDELDFDSEPRPQGQPPDVGADQLP
jgi:hypothetical protein